MARVLHLITGLHVGGAEVTLQRIVTMMGGTSWEPLVVGMMDGGRVRDDLLSAGVDVRTLGMSPGRPGLQHALALRGIMKSFRPHVIQTWMYHADLLGGVVAKSTRTPVIWNVRHSNLAPQFNKRMTLRIVRLNAALSRFLPVYVICGSHAAMDAHVRVGYARDRMVVIPNGYVVDGAGDRGRRSEIRAELGVAANIPLVGIVGRFNVQKDYETFCKAAGLVAAATPQVRFVMVGRGVDPNNEVLRDWVRRAEIEDRVFLLGPRDDVPAILSALDVFCSSSVGEGFPNVVAEAMIAGLPCVVTDVGDSARIVGNCGVVVPPQEPRKLAAGMSALLRRVASDRASIAECSRGRIRDNYSLSTIAARYEGLYVEAAAGRTTRNR